MRRNRDQRQCPRHRRCRQQRRPHPRIRQRLPLRRPSPRTSSMRMRSSSVWKTQARRRRSRPAEQAVKLLGPPSAPDTSDRGHGSKASNRRASVPATASPGVIPGIPVNGPAFVGGNGKGCRCQGKGSFLDIFRPSSQRRRIEILIVRFRDGVTPRSLPEDANSGYF